LARRPALALLGETGYGSSLVPVLRDCFVAGVRESEASWRPVKKPGEDGMVAYIAAGGSADRAHRVVKATGSLCLHCDPTGSS
jgi:hypothetical protein